MATKLKCKISGLAYMVLGGGKRYDVHPESLITEVDDKDVQGMLDTGLFEKPAKLEPADEKKSEQTEKTDATATHAAAGKEHADAQKK